MSESKQTRNSRIPKFFKLDVRDRIRALQEHGMLTAADAKALDSGTHTLRIRNADGMIENVIGVLGLPLAVGPNFLINGRDYVIPLAVEEPSIAAGLSGAAQIARSVGGFLVSSTDPILTGQVQIAHVADVEKARQRLINERQAILDLANSLHPKMVARGGGAIDIEVLLHQVQGISEPMVVLHLHVNTCDAMGANVVNGMCEGIASLVESITGGRVFLRILSNLTDQSLVTAEIELPASQLNVRNYSGDAVRDGIVMAAELARVDPYRATTHNKGIMNGIDAVALATGNDFRALEAAAHAFAARDGQYRALSSWSTGETGSLIGRLTMPIKVGTVGGSLQTNPSVRISHRLLGSPGANELACVMGAVGLAQNFAALRALATAGIQQNHMTLHARSVATTANVPPDLFDTVVESLIEDGTIKVWKAKEIVERLSSDSVSAPPSIQTRSSASAKAILLGEHAVVYGRRALAVPLPLAVEATVVDADAATLIIPRWGVEQRIPPLSENPAGVVGVLSTLLEKLELTPRGMVVEVFPGIPRAVGLGCSAAICVAVIKALSIHFDLDLSEESINQLAFECERLAHGNPSGIDNTLATYGIPLTFQRSEVADGDPDFEQVRLGTPLNVLIGVSGIESLTASMVEKVRMARERHLERYERMFDEIDMLTRAGVAALKEGKISDLGEVMDINHGYLNAMQLSTPQIEELVHLARDHGAKGAKLTGGGGGGSIIAVFEDEPAQALQAIQDAGYHGYSFKVD